MSAPGGWRGFWTVRAPVCDCNALWTAMQTAGVDTDELLANRVNHPTPALHGMFAYELVKTMFLS